MVTNNNFGTLKFDETIFDDNFNEKGRIQVYEKGMNLSYGDFNIKVPFNYIETLEHKGETNLGKIAVRMSVYDMLGNKYDIDMTMSDILFHKLRRHCLEAKKE